MIEDELEQAISGKVGARRRSIPQCGAGTRSCAGSRRQIPEVSPFPASLPSGDPFHPQRGVTRMRAHVRPISPSHYNVLRASRERHRPSLGGIRSAGCPRRKKNRGEHHASWLHAGSGHGRCARAATPAYAVIELQWWHAMTGATTIIVKLWPTSSTPPERIQGRADLQGQLSRP